MKKILASLIVTILLVSLLLTLVSCDSKEIKKLSYIDENGDVQTVSIKATEDENEVAAAIAGLSCKSIDRSTLSSLLASITCEIGYAGTNAGTPFDYDLNCGITAGASVPRNLSAEKVSQLLSNLTAYIGVTASGTMPMDFITMVFHQEYDENKVVDTSKPMVLNDAASIAYDKGVIYAKLGLTDDVAVLLTEQINDFFQDFTIDGEELATDEEKEEESTLDLTKYNNKVAKLNLSNVLPLIDPFINKDLRTTIFKVFNEIFNKESSYKALIETLIDEFDDAATKTADPQSEVPEKSYFTYVKEIVHAFNIKITNTKGSKVTFTMDITKDSLNYVEYLLEETYDSFDLYDGHAAIEVTIDAKTMLDMSISADLSPLYACNGKVIGKDLTVSDYRFKFNANISTNEAIPTLSDSDKQNSTNASDILGFITAFLI